MKKPTFTIGIEEEYQTIDPVTRDLRSHIHSEIIAKGKLRMEERIRRRCISQWWKSGLASART